MSATVGIVVFVVGLVVSVTLHEFGHLLTAKAFGMKARRFFFGFGPTLWSFHRGETEYGVKAVPAGGFVDIAGMTDREELSEADRPRAFYRQAPWKRITVMLAGIGINIVTGWLLVVVVLSVVGVPQPSRQVGTVSPCLAAATSTAPKTPTCPAGADPSPAKAAGLRSGDEIVAVDGRTTPTWESVQKAIESAGPGPATITYVRDGSRRTADVVLASTQKQGRTVGRLGVSPGTEYEPAGVWTSAKDATRYFGTVAAGTAKAVWSVPAAIPHVVGSIMGNEQRDNNGFVSVVGAAQVSGQLASTGEVPLEGRIADMLLLLAGLNLTVGLINLIPLPPFDGGHMAATVVEVVRNAVLRMMGRRPKGHIDPASYQGLTVVGVAVILLFGLLIVTNDIINPISLTPPQ